MPPPHSLLGYHRSFRGLDHETRSSFISIEMKRMHINSIIAEGRRQNVDRRDRNTDHNAIHTAFIKYPEGDGGPNMDYDWIPADQSAHIAKAILLDLEANGYHITKKA
jgi:hypothetical protein